MNWEKLGKALLAIILITTLTGCSARLQAISAAVNDQAIKAADAEALVFEQGFCRATTVGAWMRKYGRDPVKARAWNVLCNGASTATPAGGITDELEQ